MTLRWGIVSAGTISHDFVTALSTLPSSKHQVVAVAARDLEHAEKFAKTHDIPKFYGSYEDLAKDPDFDVAYIGTIHPKHFEVCTLMLDHGKHILCEKPLCMNQDQVLKLTNYAEQRNLFLMEAVWSRFLPSYQYLREQIDKGLLGEIQEIEVEFGFDLANVDRLTKKSLGGGIILDIGIYTIQLSQWVFKRPPVFIKASGILNDDGVDKEVDAVIKYSQNIGTKIKLSGTKVLSNTATIKGSKGEIKLNSFWSCNSLIDVDGTEKSWEFPKAKKNSNFINSTGLSYQAEEVYKCINEKKFESDIMSHQESILLAFMEDEMRKQVGVVYEEDGDKN